MEIMKRLVLVVGALLLAVLFPGTMGGRAGAKADCQSGGGIISCPGEFEKLQAIWMLWPPDLYNEGSRPVYPVMIEMIKALDPHVRVNLVVQSKEEEAEVKSLLKENGYFGNNLTYYPVKHFSIWARDVGPVFVKDGRGELGVVNFGFDGYGRIRDRGYLDVEGRIDVLVARQLKMPVIDSNLVAEGGAVESNGRGTVMTTEAVALSRNPGLTKTQIENEYKRVLGAKKVIWLKQGLAEDDRVTGGHIDEIARFASPHTVLLAQVLPGDKEASATSRENFRRLEENYGLLLQATDQDGKPFSIIRVPLPPALPQEIDDRGETPVRSYLNYVVANDAVLVPAYWKPGRPDALRATEEEVQRIFRSVFPGRKIISIDAGNVSRWGGGLHCLTQHMPAN